MRRLILSGRASRRRASAAGRRRRRRKRASVQLASKQKREAGFTCLPSHVHDGQETGQSDASAGCISAARERCRKDAADGFAGAFATLDKVVPTLITQLGGRSLGHTNPTAMLWFSGSCRCAVKTAYALYGVYNNDDNKLNAGHPPRTKKHCPPRAIG